MAYEFPSRVAGVYRIMTTVLFFLLVLSLLDVPAVHQPNGDASPGPDVNPITATNEAILVYGAPGTYAIRLTVTDDDGSSVDFLLPISMG